MDKRQLWFLLLIIPTILSGCGDQRILEKIGFTQATSYDLLPDGKLQIAINIPKADPESKVSREVLITSAQSSKEARINLSRQTNLILVSGQLRNALFGMSLAKSGLWNHIDTLLRDPSISPQVKITIVNGNAKDILSKDYNEHPRTGKYIDRLLEKEARGQTIPKVTLVEFTRDYYDDGIDPVAPIIKDEGDNITIDGMGLFRDDKYIAKIPPKDLVIFALLRDNLNQGELSIDVVKEDGKKELVMLSSLISTRNVEVQHDKNGKPTVILNVSIKGSVLEYIGDLKLSDDADRHTMEDEISKNLSTRGERLVEFLKEKKVDSVGIGTYIRNSMSYRAWKNLNWYEEYSNVIVKCNFEVKIKDYGKLR